MTPETVGALAAAGLRPPTPDEARPTEPCQACGFLRIDHGPRGRYRDLACADFHPWPRSDRPARLDAPPAGARIRRPGERVAPGDYLQLGTTWHLLDGTAWPGTTITAPLGNDNTVWTTYPEDIG